MASTLADQLRRTAGIELQELAGGVLSGEIPLTNAVVNRLAAQQLAKSPGAPVDAVHIEALAGDRVGIVLGLKNVPMLRDLAIEAAIQSQPEFPGRGVMMLRWSLPRLGPLAKFAGNAVSFFKAPPPGLRIDGDRVAVDIPHLLRARGMGELVDLLTRLEIHTRPGAFLITFAARIADVPDGRT
jgi:hypothetical protein